MVRSKVAFTEEPETLQVVEIMPVRSCTQAMGGREGRHKQKNMERCVMGEALETLHAHVHTGMESTLSMPVLYLGIPLCSCEAYGMIS